MSEQTQLAPEPELPATPSRRGWHYRLLVDPDKHLYILSRAPRSKWLYLTCFCRRIRKDGTCKRTDAALDPMPPGMRARTKVEHAR